MIAQLLLDGRKVLFVSEKMAALSVVHKRLLEVGLGPFCLEIHSDKANKKDVLARIGRSHRVGAPAVSSQSKLQFETLLRLRRELNEYVRTLHRPVLHDRSAFEVHGQLAKLVDVPDLAASIKVPAVELTPDREGELLRQARKLAQMPAMLLQYHDHPWFGCLLEFWSMQEQANVVANFERFRNALGKAIPLSARLADVMQAPAPGCLDELDAFLGVARLFCESPCPPPIWLQVASLSDLKDSAGRLARRSMRHRQLTTELSRLYSPRLFETDCAELDESLNPKAHSVIGTVRGSHPREILAEHGLDLERSLRSCIQALERLLRLGAEVTAIIGEQPPTTVDDCRRLSKIAAFAGTDPRPTQFWFDWAQINSLLREIREAFDNHARLVALRSELTAEFSDMFFDLPLIQWRSDFAGRYATFWRLVRPDYHRCLKQLRRVRKSSRRHATSSLGYSTLRATRTCCHVVPARGFTRARARSLIES